MTENMRAEKGEKKNLLKSLTSYLRARSIVMLLLGFSAGLPFYMIYQNLSLWLAEAGVDKGEIGLFAWTGFAFSFKFLWAPAVDRVPIPFLEKFVGRRRAWMAAAQIGIMLALIAMSAADPAGNLLVIAAIAVVLAFVAATQDIAIDAWRIEAATDEEQGVMAAMYQYGYRVAIMVAGAGALIVADNINWPAAYQFMALLMGVGLLTALFAPKVEVGEYTPPPRAPLAETMSKSVIGPFKDFFSRYGMHALVILLFIALFRVPDFLMGYMTGPLYIDLGYDKTTIGAVRSGIGLFATLFGVFLGGIIVARMDYRWSLMFGVLSQSLTNLIYSWLALSDATTGGLAFAVVVDNIAYGAAGTILIAYMSSLTNTAFTATQYALFSSFYALPGKFVGGFSGFMVEAFGFAWFFAITAIIGLPAALLIFWLKGSDQYDQSAKPDETAVSSP
ncbi:AmpG family muropeptide MFS transporter [Hyphococcus flavus]|uniref:AmpG family muropeptide MFS transporter n=1 Tax=Hyphococcus flavus TaxID=1866326 RepID=A0AAE9ZFB6_9PROT|nr:AmpG family muropeptide MFS transporter [Hyphococcus flavus]WDI32750.1 AmpG family muropeptide MFS transporter [Hyphococcus flavus]